MSEKLFIEEEDSIPIESISEVQELPDGSSVFELLPFEEETDEPVEAQFNENLALILNESRLATLAGKLLEGIEADKESRKDWENTADKVLKYAGFQVEEARNVPFMKACAAFDSSLGTALIGSYATARAELLPAVGPCKTEIIGVPTQQTEDEGERVKSFMNYYLTQMDEDYYPDSEQNIMLNIWFGCSFKKVYQNPISHFPESRTVKPFNLIVNNNCTSLLSSSRITEIMELDKKEIILRERNGAFITSDLPYSNDSADEEDSGLQKTVKAIQGISTDSNSGEKKTLFKYYETHVDLEASEVEDTDDEDDELPRPYIVTICVSTRKIVSIRRNWEEGDETFKKGTYFVNYQYLPFFGIYGLGLAHLMGSNAMTLTNILRLAIDGETLKTFPAGLRKKGMRIENNDKAAGPAEWLEVDTDGPLSEAVMPMPYTGTSPLMLELRKSVIEQTMSMVSAAEQKIPELGANTPVGTTMAVLEFATKVQSTVLRSMHKSLGRELKLLFKLFGKYLPDEPYPFAVPGGEMAIMKRDFNDKVNIVPVSDPNLPTSAHRLIRAESILRLAQGAPELHNLREVYRMMYSAMNVENIDRIMSEEPQPVALDPLAENACLIGGKPITVALFQDDEAHIIGHQIFLQDPMVQTDPRVKSTLEFHIQEHKCARAMKQIITEQQQELQMLAQQQMQGYPIDPNQLMMMGQQLQSQMVQIQQMQIRDIMMMPEVQNRVAANDAQEIQTQVQQQQEKMAKQEAMLEEQHAHQINPDEVAMADISQRREASHLKDEETKLKAETEAFKAQLKYEEGMAKLESQERMAKEKNEVNLELEQMKHPEGVF